MITVSFRDPLSRETLWTWNSVTIVPSNSHNIYGEGDHSSYQFTVAGHTWVGSEYCIVWIVDRNRMSRR